MLIIANGTMKSGSTWLFNIAREMTDYPPVPEQYLSDWRNPSIEDDKLETVLKELDIRNNNFLVKNHFAAIHQRDLLLANQDVRIININRDLRDTIVSGYYHYLRKENAEISFEEYYYGQGQTFVRANIHYRKIWDNISNPNYWLTTYTALHHDFAPTVYSLGEFLNISLSEGDIEQLHKKTSLKELRKKYDEVDVEPEKRFFRKGEIGDWENHFDAKMLEHLQGLQEEISPNMLKRAYRYLKRLVK